GEPAGRAPADADRDGEALHAVQLSGDLPLDQRTTAASQVDGVRDAPIPDRGLPRPGGRPGVHRSPPSMRFQTGSRVSMHHLLLADSATQRPSLRLWTLSGLSVKCN